MPKFPTFPTLYDDCNQISLSKLKSWGYLNPGQYRSSILTWSRNGFETGKISIAVNTIDEYHPFIELDYTYNDESRNYKIHLVSVPSNLGKGKIWYFQCPYTYRRCRILYCIAGYFFHRDAFRGCMYQSQVESKHFRNMSKIYGPYFTQEKNYEQLYKKHFKKSYAGKPTKRYLKISRAIKAADRIPISEIENLMVYARP